MQIRNTIFLLLAAFVWGITFVAQSIGSEHVDALTFLACRSWITVFVLSPIVFLRRKKISWYSDKQARRDLLRGGIICGTLLFACCATQQVGIATSTAAKAAFITVLYIIFVPLIGLFTGKTVGSRLWICVFISVFGLFLLCVKQGLSVSVGDLWLLCSSVFIAGQVLAVATFSPKAECFSLCTLQFFIIAILSTIGMFLFENPSWEDIAAAGWAIAFAGLFANAIAFTLQIAGQRNMNPTFAGLVMSLQSVFGALAGWVILDQCLNMKEFIGCCLMFGAIIVAQLTEKEK